MIKVLVFIFLPFAVFPANNPYRLIEEYSNAIYLSSDGLIEYGISTYVIDDYPVKSDGSDLMDYRAFIAEYNLVERNNSGEFDEVWLFGGDNFGFRESQNVGVTARRINSPPIMVRDCEDFIIMGFNYERGVKEMIHSFGHRVESVLAHNYDAYNELDWCYDNPYPGELQATTEYGEWLKINGTVHTEPFGVEYEQDELSWLYKLTTEQWEVILNK